jgi:hypothetical protein
MRIADKARSKEMLQYMMRSLYSIGEKRFVFLILQQRSCDYDQIMITKAKTHALVLTVRAEGQEKMLLY